MAYLYNNLKMSIHPTVSQCRFVFRIIGILLVLFAIGCGGPSTQNSPDINNSLTEYTTYCLEDPPSIGNWNGNDFFEGGFSGLFRLGGSDSVFLSITDRGPNIPLQRASDSIGIDVKLFPFPSYAPTIVRFVLRNGKMVIMNRTPLQFMEGIKATGLPPNHEYDRKTENAWINLEGDEPAFSSIGIDAEAITLENDSIAWIADEYFPALYRVSLNTGRVISSFRPSNNGPIPELYKKRKSNRGFESVALLPDGSIAAMLQSPPNWSGTGTDDTNQLIPILVFNYKTGASTTYLYACSAAYGSLKQSDFKISDAFATEKGELLIIETAQRGNTRHRMIHLIDLSKATDIGQMNIALHHFTRMPANAAQAKLLGIQTVKKSMVLDLNKITSLDKFEKLEGLCLWDSETLAIVNDNDFGVEAKKGKDDFQFTGIPSCLTLIRLPKK